MYVRLTLYKPGKEGVQVLIKYVVRKLYGNKISLLLLVAQLALSLLMLQSAMQLNTGYSQDASLLESLYADYSFSYLRDVSDQDYLMNVIAVEEDVTQRQLELYEWAKGSKDFTLLSTQLYDLIVNANFRGMGDYLSRDIGNDMVSIKAFRADEDFFRRFPVRIADGRAFQAEDYIRTDELPVIMGYNYANIYSLGDIIEVPSNAFQPFKQLKVIGFLPPQSYVACPFIPEKALVGDSYVLYPFLKPDQASSFGEYDMLLFQSVVIPINEAQARASLAQKSRELGLYSLELGQSVKPFQIQRDAARTNKSIVFLVAVTVIVFTGFTTVSMLAYRFRLRKADFGRLLQIGASNLYISGIFMLEIFAIIVLSAITAWAVSSWQNTDIMPLLAAYVVFLPLPIWGVVMFALRSEKLLGYGVKEIDA